MEYLEHEVRDGNRILRFLGRKIASGSSERPGIPRWSELAVYETRSGEFLLEKVGRSTIAHDPDCRFVTHRMPSWLEAREEGKVHRVPCPECSPLVGNAMDPHTRLEVQRYRVYGAATLQGLVDILRGDRDRIPSLVADVIRQCERQL